jgi:transposase
MHYVPGTDRKQLTMVPYCLDDFIDEYNICRVIDAFIDGLNLLGMGFKNAQINETGRPAYSPWVMLKLYLYGYLNRIRSSRRLEAETKRNIEVMWLLNNLTPNDKTICNFRKDNAEALKEVFKKFTKFCAELELIKGKTVAIDGSKFKADNGRKNCFTTEGAQNTLAKTENKINEYMKELEISDGDDSSEVETSEETIKKTLEKLNEKKEKYLEIIKKIDENNGEALCTIDEEAKLMKQGNGNGFDVCYNIQTTVDAENGLIVDFEVTDRCNDINELLAMAVSAKEVLEVENLTILADKGYSNGKEIHECEENDINCLIPSPKPSRQPKDKKYNRKNFKYDSEEDCYNCPEGNKMPFKRIRERDGFKVYSNRGACKNCPVKDRCTRSKTLREIERNPYQEDVEKANGRAKNDKKLFHKRQETVEHPFGTIKAVWGFGQFLCRGIKKTTGEAGLAFLAYNFRRIFNILGGKLMMETLLTRLFLVVLLLLDSVFRKSAIFYRKIRQKQFDYFAV